MAYARGSGSQVPRSISLACHKVAALDARELGKRARPRLPAADSSMQPTGPGPNPQVIEKDLVLGCVLAGAYDQEGLRPEGSAERHRLRRGGPCVCPVGRTALAVRAGTRPASFKFDDAHD